MYETLITKVGDTLGTCALVKERFSTPKTKLDKFPCVFFKPSGLVNEYETQIENAKIYRFMLIVMVGANNTTVANAFGTTLPKVVDQIIEAFDRDWNQGTFEGHRLRCKIDSADAWEVSEEQDGLVAYAPLNVEIRLLTSI